MWGCVKLFYKGMLKPGFSIALWVYWPDNGQWSLCSRSEAIGPNQHVISTGLHWPDSGKVASYPVIYIGQVVWKMHEWIEVS